MKRLYELSNPSDRITFRATPEEASVIAAMMRLSWYFVKDAETKESPDETQAKEFRDEIFHDRNKLHSYADSYLSFMIGRPEERATAEAAMAGMSTTEALSYHSQWHHDHRSSMNDICRAMWDRAPAIRAYEIKESADVK